MVRVLCTRKSEGGGSGKVVLIDGWLLIYGQGFYVHGKMKGVVLEKWS